MGAWASPCSAAGMQYRSQIPALLALVALAGCDLEPGEETQADPVELVSDADGERMLVPPVPASWTHATCVMACTAVAYAGCPGVSTACAAATTLTLGGIAIPCAWATSVACVVLPTVGAGACSQICPE